MIDPEFWAGCRVFLTGHTGFKGAWLSFWLQRLGAKVTGYSIDIPSEPSLFEAARIAAGMTDLRGDINDVDALSAALATAEPQVMIHAAAQSLVRASYVDPLGTFRTNVIGTANVLQAARTVTSLKAVLIVTSDKCYENREWVWGYRETDAMGGHDPYSASKGAAEIVTNSMRRSFFHPDDYGRHGVAVASVRSGNVIGGGDWSADRLIPDLMRAFSAGRPAIIRNPRAVRPWQFVLDPLAGYLMLCERLWRDGPTFGEAWNFGPDWDCDRPVGELVETAKALWGAGATADIDRRPTPHEAAILRLDTAKARRLLGWKPKAGYQDAMQMTIDWYRAFYNGRDARELCAGQIGKWGGLGNT